MSWTGHHDYDIISLWMIYLPHCHYFKEPLNIAISWSRLQILGMVTISLCNTDVSMNVGYSSTMIVCGRRGYGLTKYNLQTGGEYCHVELAEWPNRMTQLMAAGKLCVALSYRYIFLVFYVSLCKYAFKFANRRYLNNHYSHY